MPNPTYVFVGYCDRSGSTFLLNELNKIDGVVACPEFDLLVRLLLKKPHKKLTANFTGKFRNTCLSSSSFKIWDILPEQSSCITRIDLFFAMLYQYANKISPNSTCIVYKERSILEYHRILSQYPEEVKFVSLIRDPRAIYASQRKTLNPITNRPISQNPVSTARSWNRHCKVTDSLLGSTNTRSLLYESLIKESASTIQCLYEWVSNTNQKYRLKDNTTVNPFFVNYNHMHSMVGRPPQQERINAWKNDLSNTDIFIVEQASKPQMIGHAYTLLTDTKPTEKLRLAYALKIAKHMLTSVYWWVKVLCRKIFFTGFTSSQ